ncbi:hypothetical protein ONZ45_g16256 [Pleurotus djamor]|nr:hypothetical protein ONZ45_g16256 [Pleurotus djamor]
MPALALPSTNDTAYLHSGPDMKIPLIVGVAVLASSVAIGALYVLVKVILRVHHGHITPVQEGVAHDEKANVDVDLESQASSKVFEEEEEADITTTLDVVIIPPTKPMPDLACQPQHYVALVEVLEAIEMHHEILSEYGGDEPQCDEDEMDVADVEIAPEEPFPLPFAIPALASSPTSEGLISAFKSDVFDDDESSVNDNEEDRVLAAFDLDTEVRCFNVQHTPVIKNNELLPEPLHAQVELHDLHLTPITFNDDNDDCESSPLPAKVSPPTRPPLVPRQPRPSTMAAPVTTPIRPSSKVSSATPSSSLRRIPAIKGRPRPTPPPPKHPTPRQRRDENISTPNRPRPPSSMYTPIRPPSSTSTSLTKTPMRSSKHSSTIPPTLLRSSPRFGPAWR